ncbi:MAG TPA: copper chaperone PCu(A)C [Paraburkholderia sp.]|jgi:copper(I)-binding protein|nr:copper chaperone PCu(A)C [Paraburkholderia sp.]
MKRSIRILAALSLASASAGAFAASATVSDCWVRLMPGNLPSGAYFNVNNASNAAIELQGVDTDAFGMAMLHRTQSNGSTSTMEMVESATVPANGTLKFAPGGYHVMLEEPKHPLKVGSTIALTFTFGNGEKTTAQCAVKSPATMAK